MAKSLAKALYCLEKKLYVRWLPIVNSKLWPSIQPATAQLYISGHSCFLSRMSQAEQVLPGARPVMKMLNGCHDWNDSEISTVCLEG